MKIKPISKSSWILLNVYNEQIGILSFNGTYNLIHNKEKHLFENKEDLNEFLGCDVFENILETKEVKFEPKIIKGYPIDLDSAIEVEDQSLPLYTKNDKSKIVYAAGYYCIEYTSIWSQAYCPKLETLNKYRYHGPFKDKIEMRLKLNNLNK